MIGKHRNIYPSEWKLLYQGSRDGYKIENCHPKCYDHPNVALIVETQSGNVFGGFTAKGWKLNASAREHRADPNAFLFLIRAKTHDNKHEIFPIKKSKIDRALCHYPFQG